MSVSTLKKPFADIVSATRVAKEQVTTGPTGNIALPYVNDGYTAIVAPHTSGSDHYIRAWVNAAGSWYLTVINPNTGATVNNAAINLRYWVFKFATP